MTDIRRSIRFLYPIALAEGEGLGTAYEYHVKLRKLQTVVDRLAGPKRILIAGLPERYGLSLDFVLIGHLLGAETVVIDDRQDALDRAREAAAAVAGKGIMAGDRIVWRRVSSLSRLEAGTFGEGEFDLVLTSEVVQRLPPDARLYLDCLKSWAAHLAVFAPNSGNRSHTRISGLRGVSLEELTGRFGPADGRLRLADSGYVDLPPFPPGLSRSQAKRERATRGRLEAAVMKGLEIYSLFENILPLPVRKARAHIVYIIAQND